MITLANPRFEAPIDDAASEPQDGSLARRAKTGDARALAELVRRHAKAVHGLCFHLAGPGDVNDATQESLEKIVTRIGSFDPTKGSFRSWALAVARHICLDRLRRRGRERRAFHADGEAETQAAVSTAPDPERSALALSDARDLRDALGALPEPMRTALVLFHLHEASYEEIAATLEVPIGTVMTWLHRGRKRLREVFDGRSEETP
jgi:RNA polymerase sigma-70 factor, ECF subfamily